MKTQDASQDDSLIAYRCPKCGGANVGFDAYSSFDPVKQEWVLGGTYDNGWCGVCSDVDPEQYELEGDELTEVLAQRAEDARRSRMARSIVALLLQRVRKARRRVRKLDADEGKDLIEYAIADGEACEAHNAAELARRLLYATRIDAPRRDPHCDDVPIPS